MKQLDIYAAVRRRVLMPAWQAPTVVITLIFIAGTTLTLGRGFYVDPKPIAADRYYIRVSGCDDGGRAFVNKTQVVDVGFNEDSDWLDITEDLTKDDNKIKFEVMNKTGAITYVFQVRKKDKMIFTQACGTAAIQGCENNRAFHLGVAREFTFTISTDE